MTVISRNQLASDLETLLVALSWAVADAADAAAWMAATISYARTGEDTDRLNRASWVDKLRLTYGRRDGSETRAALNALDLIEQQVFHGTRVPVAFIRQRFYATSMSVWDKELNRWWCHDCESWIDYDGHQHPLSPYWCPAGHQLVL